MCRSELRSVLTVGLSASLCACAGAAQVSNGSGDHQQTRIVEAGAGSYIHGVPDGASAPSLRDGTRVLPRVTDDFTGPTPSNEFWSSLIFPRDADRPHAYPMHAHPLSMRASAEGLVIGHVPEPRVTETEYHHTFGGREGRDGEHLTLGVAGLNAPEARVASYGDWTVTASVADAEREARTTFGHGLPYVYVRTRGGDAQVRLHADDATVWANRGGTLGITLRGIHYGVFSRSDWTIDGTILTAPMGGEPGYYSVAVLPDSDPGTLSLFERHAFAFVTGSRVDWRYDAENGESVATYSLETEAVHADETRPITALYRHQWLHTPEFEPVARYASPRGEMRALVGNSFTTRTPFRGVLPTLADTGAVAPSALRALIEEDTRPRGRGRRRGHDTYFDGKRMARTANLVMLAEQAGDGQARDALLAGVQAELEDWLTIGPDERPGGASGDGESDGRGHGRFFFYDPDWHTLIGTPGGFGMADQLNDHHFHYGYFVYAASIVAMHDPAWAEAWGPMVELLIRDANGWDRDDDRFPFLRGFDPYAGHAWASGTGAYRRGNNQESSSESVNFAVGCVFWGMVTGRQDIAELGIYLHATESAAIGQYWFDQDGEVFPEVLGKPLAGIVWSDGIAYHTWWTGNPEQIHGINTFPMHAGMLYLGQHPKAIIDAYELLMTQREGTPNSWTGIIWSALALADPARAKALADANPGYDIEGGDSRARTTHWIDTLARVGPYAPEVRADHPAAAAFGVAGDRHYMAWNPGTEPLTVTFSDGFAMEVAPGELLHSAESD
ncbi:MAG: glycosyl hydrolase [Phycisphaerales bacterium JB040]